MMTTRSRTQRMATEPQVNYVRSLLARRDTSTVPDLVRVVKNQLDGDGLTFATASSAIDVLKALPATREIADRDTSSRSMIDAMIVNIPEGHYAIEVAPDEWRFYQVDRPTDGRWAGFTFLKVQAGDEFYPIKNLQERAKVLTRIAEDPRRAAVDYGKKIGRCWRCHRTLTDRESLEAGIGPICAGKVGW